MLKRLLYWVTAKMPCRLIQVDDEAYLERYYVGTRFGITVYLHRFVAEDGDRSVHDHPWTWSGALILSGGYREERLSYLDPQFGWHVNLRRMFPGRLNRIGAGDFHRVTETKPDTWTLFFHGKKIKSWGFLNQLENGEGVLYHPKPETQKTPHWSLWPKGSEAGRASLCLPQSQKNPIAETE